MVGSKRRENRSGRFPEDISGLYRLTKTHREVRGAFSTSQFPRWPWLTVDLGQHVLWRHYVTLRWLSWIVSAVLLPCVGCVLASFWHALFASWRVIFLPAVGMLSCSQDRTYMYLFHGKLGFPHRRTHLKSLVAFFPFRSISELCACKTSARSIEWAQSFWSAKVLNQGRWVEQMSQNNMILSHHCCRLLCSYRALVRRNLISIWGKLKFWTSCQQFSVFRKTYDVQDAIMEVKHVSRHQPSLRVLRAGTRLTVHRTLQVWVNFICELGCRLTVDSKCTLRHVTMELFISGFARNVLKTAWSDARKVY